MREGWTYKKLGEVASVADYVANGSFATLRENVHYLDSKGYAILIRYADYSNGFDSNKYVYIDEHAYNFLSKSKLYGGEIIMSNVGSIGKSFICPKLPMPMSLAPNSIVINTPNNRFYQYYFKSNSFQGLLKTISSKTALPKFNKTQFKGLVAPVPPLSEQQRIVSELDLLSSIIEKKKAQLKEYDQLAQSIFYDMFGDPVSNEKGWEVKKLVDCCKNCDSQRKPITAKDRIKGTIPYYGASGVVDYVKDYIFDGEYLLISEDGANLIIRSTPIAFRIKGKTWVNNHAHVLQFDALFKQIFMEYSINLRDISSIVTGCAQPKLTQAAMNNINIPYPPLFLQQSFASKIEAIECQKALIQQSITEVETLFNSRMDYYFN